MKMKMRKVLAVTLAVVMTLALSMTAFAAQTHSEAYTGADGDGASITVNNAAKGETYKVYKIFDATVTGTTDGSISYQGTIPAALTDYFEYVSGNDSTYGIRVKDAGKDPNDATKLSSDAVAALKAYVASDAVKETNLLTAESDGQPLTFTNLPYGFYVVTSTQNNGAAITVDSTNPSVTINDKNTTPPVNNLTKSASETDVYIGQTVTYTVSFDTANYDGLKQIVKYEITDTPAANALTGITVTSIKVGDTPIATQQFTDGKITINWAKDGVKGESLYANGAKLEITYTGVVADTAAIDGAGNKNTVEVKPILDDGTSPGPSTYTDDETIFTYAIAVKKVNQAGVALGGATFEFPFYVKATPAEDGAYIYAGTTAGTGLVNEITTPDDTGLIIVKGVKTGTYSITETEAPAGFNKLGAPVEVTAVKTGESTTSTTTYLDKDGNIVAQETTGGSTVIVSIDELAATPIVVVNKTGAELPSTGGMGTKIFYGVGAILVIGAGVVLVSRKRAGE